MSGGATLPADRVVLAPDVIGGGLWDAACAKVLERWRDGTVILVTSQELTRRYLKLLREFGLAEELLRWWLWWFTLADHLHYVPEDTAGPAPIRELCARLAAAAQARWILHTGLTKDLPPEEKSATTGCAWISCADFLRMRENT